MLQSISDDDGSVQSKRYQKAFQCQVGNKDYMQKAAEKLLEIRPLSYVPSTVWYTSSPWALRMRYRFLVSKPVIAADMIDTTTQEDS